MITYTEVENCSRGHSTVPIQSPWIKELSQQLADRIKQGVIGQLRRSTIEGQKERKRIGVGVSGARGTGKTWREGQPVDSQLFLGFIRSLSQFLTSRIFIIPERFRKSFQTCLVIEKLYGEIFRDKEALYMQFSNYSEKAVYLYMLTCLHGC